MFIGARRWQIDPNDPIPEPLEGTGIRPPVQMQAEPRFEGTDEELRETVFFRCDRSLTTWLALPDALKVIGIGVAIDMYSHAFARQLLEEGLVGGEHWWPRLDTEIKSILENPSIPNLFRALGSIEAVTDLLAEADPVEGLFTAWPMLQPLHERLVQTAGIQYEQVLESNPALLVIENLIREYVVWRYPDHVIPECWQIVDFGPEADTLAEGAELLNQYFQIWWADVQSVWAWRSLEDLPEYET